MKRVTVVLICLLAICELVAQENYYHGKTRWISAEVNTGEIRCEISTRWNVSSNVNENTRYYWYDRAVIHDANGAYAGYLLDGIYLAYDKNKNLIEKGIMNKGKKIGLWQRWDDRGYLIEKTKWRKGLQNGKAYTYSDSIINVRKFKKNSKHGWARMYINDILVKKERYRNNILVKSIDLKKKEKLIRSKPEADKQSNKKLNPAKVFKKLLTKKVRNKSRDNEVRPDTRRSKISIQDK